MYDRYFLRIHEKMERFGDDNQTSFIVRKICLDAYAINKFQKAKQSSGFGKVTLAFSSKFK